MRKRFTKIVAGLAALAALALGGATLASAGGSPSAPSDQTPAVVQPGTSAADAETNDAAKTGDAETADSSTSPDTDAIQSETGNDGAAEQSGSEQPAGSEVPGNDGPGGHADEPGNPNADHQAEGQE